MRDFEEWKLLLKWEQDNVFCGTFVILEWPLPVRLSIRRTSFSHSKSMC